eukprot:1371627-Amorphochlora_amoeboformis.AAC.1
MSRFSNGMNLEVSYLPFPSGLRVENTLARTQTTLLRYRAHNLGLHSGYLLLVEGEYDVPAELEQLPLGRVGWG